MEGLSLKRGLFGTDISVLALFLDNGITVTLAGGDFSHIGAVSCCTPGGNMHTTVFPGHKEAVLSESWAKRLMDEFGVPVSVSCGIHYDNLSHEGICTVLEVCGELLDELVIQAKPLVS